MAASPVSERACLDLDGELEPDRLEESLDLSSAFRLTGL